LDFVLEYIRVAKIFENKDEISQQKIKGKVSEKIKETSLISLLGVLEN
jgi:hypothetical protein